MSQLREELKEAQDKYNEYNKRASQIYVKMGGEYVSALSLIETYKTTTTEGVARD